MENCCGCLGEWRGENSAGRGSRQPVRVHALWAALLIVPLALPLGGQDEPPRIRMSQEATSPDGRCAIVTRGSGKSSSVYVYTYSPKGSSLLEANDSSSRPRIASPRELVWWSRDSSRVAWVGWTGSARARNPAVVTASIRDRRLQSLVAHRTPDDATDMPLGWLDGKLVVTRLSEGAPAWQAIDPETGGRSALSCSLPDGMRPDQPMLVTSRPGKNPGSVVARALVVHGAGRPGATCYETLIGFSMGKDRKGITARSIAMLCTLSREGSESSPAGYRFLRQRPEHGKVVDWSVVGADVFVAVQLASGSEEKAIEVWSVRDAEGEATPGFVCRLHTQGGTVRLCPFAPLAVFVPAETGGRSRMALLRIGEDNAFRKTDVEVRGRGAIGDLVFVSSDLVLIDIGGELFELDLRAPHARPKPIAWGQRGGED